MKNSFSQAKDFLYLVFEDYENSNAYFFEFWESCFITEPSFYI